MEFCENGQKFYNERKEIGANTRHSVAIGMRTTLKIKKICFSPKVSIQPSRPKSDSALPAAI